MFSNLQITLAAGVAIIIVGLSATVMVQHEKLKSTSKELAEANVKVTSLTGQLSALQKANDKQVGDIQRLMSASDRFASQIAPIQSRIDNLPCFPVFSNPTQDTPNAKSDLVDRLNGINSDLNRMLEHESRPSASSDGQGVDPTGAGVSRSR